MLDRALRMPELAGDERELLAGWAERGWPVIVRRPALGETGGIAVGVPMPPALGKRRVGLTVPVPAVARMLPLVALEEAAALVPPRLRPQIDAVLALGRRLALRPAVFGALLWQHLTGLSYLRPASDLDLLWPAPDRDIQPDLLAGLARIDEHGAVRLDGEILFSGGAGVNWRELHAEIGRPAGAVLVKSMKGTELRCARTLFA
ncbi:malonate decarboxylase holo-[acyl-carrier-protein] synthase [Mesorhizobium sp. YC-39]|nr:MULTISPECIES: malonate decarboxylase holo-[acyl-carrier-protein] synthase [unclassified Mesorhizobium]MCV3206523.1 malonate decarboxylase holo-[acyl-carrier-protein] synthase [Mesorhizobium sp. YC-2]MCV3227077.1 malonate decarboxylase holo-[acyl-carrier-protein] synthase [Mesorhizobium sp. YC-39]